MSGWSINDTEGAKPKFLVERQVEGVGGSTTIFGTANANTNYLAATANVLTLLSATGITTGMYVSGNNINYSSPVPGFFKGNVSVTAVDAPNNLVTLSSPVSANVITGDVFQFDTTIPYKATTYESTYNRDTILVTKTRLANALVNVNHAHTGWTHVRKKINGDGTVRYISEVLVATSNAVAANVSSANTSNAAIYSGV